MSSADIAHVLKVLGGKSRVNNDTMFKYNEEVRYCPAYLVESTQVLITVWNLFVIICPDVLFTFTSTM